MTATKHNLTASKYRRAGLSGIGVYDHDTWMRVETSAGRDWSGSCYSTSRGYIARAKDGGWLAFRVTNENSSESFANLSANAVWFPTLLRAISYVRPNRRRDFAR